MKTKTIKQIKQLFTENKLTNATINELRHDKRKGVQAIVSAYEREQLKQEKLIEQFETMCKLENHYRSIGKKFIAGVDEAGRGPLAGPVVAAAVILPAQFKLLGLNDSKQLNEEKRIEFSNIIKKEAISYHISIIDNEEIDDINIFEATKKAMKEALIHLNPLPDKALIDAVQLDSLPFSSRSIIKGDEKCISIAAASVLAKVARDDLMKKIDEHYPVYRFKTNMGYGTKEHLQMIERHGVSPYHRKSYSPVKRLLTGGD